MNFAYASLCVVLGGMLVMQARYLAAALVAVESAFIFVLAWVEISPRRDSLLAA